MFAFGKTSRAKLDTVDPKLQAVTELVMSWQIMDFAIVWGFRGEDAQEQAFRSGNSTKRWPDSLHNKHPSPAIDVAPYHDGGIPWNDKLAFAVLAGLFKAAGAHLGTPIRWGGDWDSDGSTTDQKFMDLGHLEIKRGAS